MFGIGYADVTAVIVRPLVWTKAIILAVSKVIAVFLAVGSGGCGGRFFLGTMFGGAVAGLANQFLPLTDSDVSMLVISGMCAGFVAVIRTPITLHPAHLRGHASICDRAVPVDRDGRRPCGQPPPGKRGPPLSHDEAGRRKSARYAFSPRFPQMARDAGGAFATGLQPKLEPAIWGHAEQPLSRAQNLLIESPSGFLCLGDADEKRIAGVFTLHDLRRGQENLLDGQVCGGRGRVFLTEMSGWGACRRR